MADIELVIKIPEDEYNFIRAQVTEMGITNPLRLCIANGIPLDNVLDEIRAGIEQRPYGIANNSVIQGMKHEREDIFEFIDKYKAERGIRDNG